MNSILIEVEKNLSANSLNATKQQTNLQNKNDTVVSDDEVPIPTSELCSVIKNESILKIQSEFANLPSLIQNKRKTSLITEDFDLFNNNNASLNMGFDSDENNKIENNSTKYEQKKVKNSVSINTPKDCLMFVEPDLSIKDSTELGKQRNFDIGDNYVL